MMFLKNTKMIPFCGRIILSQNSFLKIPRRNGFLILVPEIGEDLPGKYPLLKEDKSIEFNTITVEKCVAAMGRQALEFEETVKALEKKLEKVDNISSENLFKDIIDPIDELTCSLQSTWGIAKILYVGNQSLMPTNCYMNIDKRANTAIASKYYSKLIYRACKSILDNKEIKLVDEQKSVLTRFVVEGKLNGLELSEKDKLKFEDLTLRIMNNIQEYTTKLETALCLLNFKIKDPEILKEFPENVLKAMLPSTSSYNVGSWSLNLSPAYAEIFMEYCSNRVARWKVWEANVTKASTLQDKSPQASTALEELRAKRNQLAKMLGYRSFADFRMETNMAGSVKNVHQVLNQLLETARPAQEYEIKELGAFAKERGLEGTLQQWDIAYWSRKQLQSICKFPEKDVKHYFPLPNVLAGLFELIETLFNVKIVENKKPDVWHKDVRFFHVFDLSESSTDPVGSFYLDPYAREDEKVRLSPNSGYMVAAQNKSKISGVKPLSALIFNFEPSLGDKPSLLSLKDLEVLFHKIGHMLQHTLTQVGSVEVSGLSFLEWDAAHTSDFFFENWLYKPFVLQQLSSYRDTGEELPAEVIETIQTIRTHFTGYKLCKELYFSRFDLELYSGDEFWNDIMGHIWDKYFVIPAHKRDCYICSFDTIFSGHLPARYYSTTWSRMLGADLYDAFQDIPSDNEQLLREVGTRYRKTFFALGGSYSTNEVFRMFRGRDPSPKALLKSLGLDTKARMLESTEENNLVNGEI